jgi:hypothetical protein
VITNTTASQFEIPIEMRVAAQQSVQQAKLAFENYVRVIEEATSAFEDRFEASQTGAQNAKKAMNFALQSVTLTFEFAQKIVQSKNVMEFIRLLNDFLESQMHVLSEQVKEFGETLSKAATDSMKVSKGELVS